MEKALPIEALGLTKWFAHGRIGTGKEKLQAFLSAFSPKLKGGDFMTDFEMISVVIALLGLLFVAYTAGKNNK